MLPNYDSPLASSAPSIARQPTDHREADLRRVRRRLLRFILESHRRREERRLRGLGSPAPRLG